MYINLFLTHRIFFIVCWWEIDEWFYSKWNISWVMKSILVWNFSLGNIFVKLFIFVISNLSLISVPHSLHCVDMFSIELYWISNEERKLSQDSLGFSWLTEVSTLRCQCQFNLSSSFELYGIYVKYFEISRSIRNPSHSFRTWITLWNHFHMASYNESTVEPNSKLPNNVICFSIFSQWLHKLLWPRLGNSSKIINNFLLSHSNSRIKDDHCSILLISNNIDVERFIAHRCLSTGL